MFEMTAVVFVSFCAPKKTKPNKTKKRTTNNSRVGIQCLCRIERLKQVFQVGMPTDIGVSK